MTRSFVTRRAAALVTAGALGTLSLTVAPAQASTPDCTDGSYMQYDFTGAVQECLVPGTSGSGRTVGMQVYRMYGGGGGGGGNGDYADGGDAGEIAFDLSVAEGETLSLYVGGGGAESDNDNDYTGDGGGGGGSSAIVSNGVPLAEAGGGGGAQNDDEGGSANAVDPRKGDDGSTVCAGKGGNQDLTGTGGTGGPRALGCVGGPAGYPVTGTAGGNKWSGDGGDGASAIGETAHTDYGGWGWSNGGDGGRGTLDAEGPSAGSGGGGGYGDGGGGAASGLDNDDAIGSGGGGGSMVRPSAIGGTADYSVASNGASEDPGGPGQIAFSVVGPAVLTKAAAPTGVTGTTATTHSTVDPNSTTPVDTITIEYSTDPDFATGVMSVPGDPASLPGVIGDQPVTASLTGLTPGTVYYYRIVAVNPEVTTAGKIEVFQTPITVTGITPKKGPDTGGTTVTITGTGFRSGTSVLIGGVACKPVTIVSGTSLTCRTGAHPPATVDVVVTNPGPDSQSATLPMAYTYTPSAPDVSITDLTPKRGTTKGGTRVTIAGTGFTTGTTVTLGGSPCRPVIVTSPTRLTCTTTAHPAGWVSAVVTVPNATSARLTDAFRYVPPTPPSASLTVKAKKKKRALKVNKPATVVRAVDADGRVKITARCLVNGHRLKRACDITIRPGKGRVIVTPTCSDGVRVHVRIVARKNGTKDVWTRSWRTDRTPRITCAAGANG